MKKKLAFGVLVFVGVLALGIVFFGQNVDSVLKIAVERYGTQATGVRTTLGKVALSLSDGRGALERFKIGNPKGFSDSVAIAFDKVMVDVDPNSVMGKGPVVIREILVSAPEILYEIAQDGTNNLGTIQKNVATYARSFQQDKNGAETKGVPSPRAETAQSARKVIIDKLVIEGGHVRVNHALIADKALDVVLPTLSLQGLGRDAGGLDPAMVAQIVMTHVTSKIMTLSKSVIVEKLREQGAASLKEAFKESDVGQAIGGFLGK